jgi:D-alanyl-lipoteichoic acid acyltransferase DltB (MBOAT superfamily)
VHFFSNTPLLTPSPPPTALSVIWRFFRLWALLDGIDTRENMLRCVNANQSFAGFWRAWHASFNAWTVRYLYVPLGGAATQRYSVWVIFLFIGMWHEIAPNWAAWALMNCLCFSLEMVAFKYLAGPVTADLRTKWYWRALRGLGGSVTVIGLELTNLCIMHGFHNSMLFARRAFLSDWTGLSAQLVYNWGVSMVQYEVHDFERSRGIFKKY